METIFKQESIKQIFSGFFSLNQNLLLLVK